MMNGCQFAHIAVIGYGVVTGEVLRLVQSFSSKYRYTVEYIEHEVHPFNTAKKFAEAGGIELHVIEDKKDLTAHFEKMLAQKTLIVSASNNYLFPAKLISNTNAIIINFHNALLPELPGRNAPSWAIYEGRTYTGITWHYVTEGVDAGDIIVQKRCEIPPDIKAYELVSIQMQIAAEAFAECYEPVLAGTAVVRKQRISADRRIYKSYEIPGDGYFNLDDPPEAIYRLLRSMDYGKNDIFPLPRSMKDGQAIQIRRYKKIPISDAFESPDRIYIPMDDDYCLMLRVETVGAPCK